MTVEWKGYELFDNLYAVGFSNILTVKENPNDTC